VDSVEYTQHGPFSEVRLAKYIGEEDCTPKKSAER
jgi:hypothetical protein